MGAGQHACILVRSLWVLTAASPTEPHSCERVVPEVLPSVTAAPASQAHTSSLSLLRLQGVDLATCVTSNPTPEQQARSPHCLAVAAETMHIGVWAHETQLGHGPAPPCKFDISCLVPAAADDGHETSLPEHTCCPQRAAPSHDHHPRRHDPQAPTLSLAADLGLCCSGL